MDELGTLIIKLLFDDSDFNKDVAQAAGKLQTAARSLESLAGTVNQKIVTAFKAGTVAVAGFTAAATFIGATFQKEIAIVGAVAGANADELKALTEVARELGATTTFTATQAATALQNFARAGLSVKESIEASTPALALAQATAADLSLATASTVATLAQFQLEATEAGRVADVLTNATTRTQFGLEGLTSALRQAGPAGKAAGLSLEETVAAVSQFRNLGLEASQAGTIFRNVITRLVNPSAQAAEAIADLGLTLQDVDPTVVGFDELLLNLRRAGATTADFSTIFGRFGLQVSGVADNVDDVNSGFLALTSTFETEVGKAADVATQATDNVLDQFRLLASAVQEVFLSVFDSFSQPLADLLDSVISVVGVISERFQEAAGGIRESAQEVADALSEFLGRNAANLAEVFVALAEGVLQVVTLLGLLIPILNALAPALTAVAQIFGGNLGIIVVIAAITALNAKLVQLTAQLVITATRGAALAKILGVDLAGASKVAGLAVQGMGRFLVSSGAGLVGLVVGLTAAAAAFINFTDKVRRARDEQRKFDAEQAGSAADRAARAEEEERLTEVLDAQQREAARVLRSGEELTTEREKELTALVNLTGATALAAVESGRLIETNEGLRQTSQVIEELGEGGADDLAAFGDEALRAAGNITAAGNEIIAKADEIADLKFTVSIDETVIAATVDRVTANLSELGDTGEAIAAGIQEAVEEAAASGEDLANALDQALRTAGTQLQEQGERNADSAKALLAGVATFARQQQERQTQTADRESNKRIAASKREAEERKRLAQEAADDIEAIFAGAQEAAAGLFLTDAQQVRRDLDAQEAALRAATRTILETGQRTAEERADIERTANEALLLLRVSAAERLQELDEGAAENARVAAERGRDAVLEATRDSLSEEEALRAQGASTLVDLEQAAQEQIQAIRAQFAAQLVDPSISPSFAAGLARERAEVILEVEQQLAADRITVNEATTDAIASAEEARLKALDDNVNAALASIDAAQQAAITSFFDAPGALERSFATALGNIRDIAAVEFNGVTRVLLDVQQFAEATANAIGDAFSALTDGFALDIQGLIGEVVDGQNRAADNVAKAQEALDDARQSQREGDATEEDIRQAESDLRAAQDQARRAGEEGIGASLVENAADAALAFTDSLAENIGPILQQFAESLPVVVQNVAEQLGPILEGLTAGVVAIIGALPDIVQSLVDAIPTVISAVVEAIPQIVQAIVDAIPGILEAIFEAIPGILIEIANAVPAIITSIVEAVPDIIAGIVGALPTLIEGVIAAVPDIIGALIEALPALIEAVVFLVPDIILALVEAVPDIVAALIAGIFGPEGLVSKLPQLAVQFVAAIGEALTGLFDRLVQLFKDVFNAVLGPLGDLFGGGGGEGDGLFRGEGFFDRLEATLFGGGGPSAQGGIAFATRRIRTLIEPGEAVLTSAENRARLFTDRGRALNPTTPTGLAPPSFGGGGFGGGGVLVVQIGDEVVDRFNIEADARGGLGLSNKASRRKTGSKTGFKRRK